MKKNIMTSLKRIFTAGIFLQFITLSSLNVVAESTQPTPQKSTSKSPAKSPQASSTNPTPSSTNSESPSGLLPENELLPALEEATKNLRAALNVKANHKKAYVEVSKQYETWQLQCLLFIADDEKSALWKPCLSFNAFMFEADKTGEAVTLLNPLIEKHSKKLTEVIATLNEKEQDLLKKAIESAKEFKEE